MIILEHKIYLTLCDIIDYVYEENRDKYKKFYISIIPKESKRCHGLYKPKTKAIEIYNLSRPYNHIILTVLHELSHHIDSCDRGDSNHKKPFYDIFYKLIIAALELKIISKRDIITETDSKDRDTLQKYYGSIKNWEIETRDEYKKDIKIIKVINSFAIKDYLKIRGYKYSKLEQAWIKELKIDRVIDELNKLRRITDEENIKIYDRSDLKIEAIYYIVVLNSFNHKDILKANGYIYNGYGINKKSWNKKINAQDLKAEEEELNELEGIKVKIIKKKAKTISR